MYQHPVCYESTQNASFASVFHTPPPPKKKKGRTPSPNAKRNNSPALCTCILVLEIGALKAKITHNFGGKINRQSAKNVLRMHHLHPFLKYFLGETPTPPPPFCERIKKLPSLALYDPLQLYR